MSYRNKSYLIWNPYDYAERNRDLAEERRMANIDRSLEYARRHRTGPTPTRDIMWHDIVVIIGLLCLAAFPFWFLWNVQHEQCVRANSRCLDYCVDKAWCEKACTEAIRDLSSICTKYHGINLHR